MVRLHLLIKIHQEALYGLIWVPYYQQNKMALLIQVIFTVNVLFLTVQLSYTHIKYDHQNIKDKQPLIPRNDFERRKATYPIISWYQFSYPIERKNNSVSKRTRKAKQDLCNIQLNKQHIKIYVNLCQYIYTDINVYIHIYIKHNFMALLWFQFQFYKNHI